MTPTHNKKEQKENSGFIQFDTIVDNVEIEKNIIDFIYEEQKKEEKEKLEIQAKPE